MKKIVAIVMASALLALTGCGSTAPEEQIGAVPGYRETTLSTVSEEETVSKASEEYNAYISDMANFPVSFVYGGVAHKGFGRNFKLLNKSAASAGDKRETDFTFLHRDGKLSVTLKTAFYPDYDAYDWTVYFTAVGKTNTAVLENVLVADIDLSGSNPTLKGINGDYGYLYSPYVKSADELTQGVSFEATSGRSTAYGFPYFNLETDDGGYMAAIGWPGTWHADFKSKGRVTHLTATGTIGMRTYLKPGETVRTPLMAFVRYFERDEDVATNTWRRWYIDCNMPKENGEKLSPKVSVCLPLDRDSATQKTMGDVAMRTLENMYEHGFVPDLYWHDATWFQSIRGDSLSYLKENGDIVCNWYKVGSWTVDSRQWSNLPDICDLVHENGGKTMLWFEPERIGDDDVVTLKNNLGIKPEWLLFRQQRDQILLNLGNPDALEYIFKKICSVIDANGIDFYREDFNMDPIDNWLIGDGLQGEMRNGITENLHVQGHLKLWDMLLERYPGMIIDSCASGGNRNDLETMRRAVAMHRTDAEEFNTANTSISMNHSMFKWIPYFGSAAYDRANDMKGVEQYNSRAGYAGVYKSVFLFNTVDGLFDKLNEYTAEYKKFGKYLFNDYYPLTDWHSQGDTGDWTAWEFFDGDKNEGVVQLFRQDNCSESKKNIKLKGLKRDCDYQFTDGNGHVRVARISGATLMDDGYDFTIGSKRGSDVIFIKQV